MASIYGRITVRGRPQRGAYVVLLGRWGQFVSERTTADDGRYAFRVDRGSWTVEARARTVGAVEARRVEIAAGDAEADIDLQPAV